MWATIQVELGRDQLPSSKLDIRDGCYSGKKGKKPRKIKVWLVTRHWIADHPKREVVAIFSPRLGGVRVREFVELMYVTGGYFTWSEQMAMAWPRHGRTPYPARFGQNANGEPWACEILCGDDPYLRARLVDDLTVKRGANGKEKVTWKERSRPSSN